jgi:hypothetical protein
MVPWAETRSDAVRPINSVTHKWMRVIWFVVFGRKNENSCICQQKSRKLWYLVLSSEVIHNVMQKQAKGGRTEFTPQPDALEVAVILPALRECRRSGRWGKARNKIRMQTEISERSKSIRAITIEVSTMSSVTPCSPVNR